MDKVKAGFLRFWRFAMVEHQITTVFFAFVFLATIPFTLQYFGFPLPGLVQIAFKATIAASFSLYLLIRSFVKRIALPWRAIVFVVAICLGYTAYHFALPRYFYFEAPPYSPVAGLQLTYDYAFSERFSALVALWSLGLFFVLFFLIAPRLGLKYKDLVVFAFYFIGYLAIASGYAVLTQTKTLIQDTEGFCSFFGNKNTYGLFLLIGAFLAYFGQTFAWRRWMRVFFAVAAVVLVIFTVLSLSFTALILTVLLVLYAYAKLAFAKGGKLRWRIIYVVAILGVLAFVLVFLLMPPFSTSRLGEMFRVLFAKLFTPEQQGFYGLFSFRGAFWMFAFYLFRGPYIVLGYGINALEAITYQSNVTYLTTAVLTNGFLTTMNAYGVVGLLLLIGLFVYAFYFLHKTRFVPQNRWIFVFWVLILIYCLFESLLLFDSFCGSLIITPILVIPAVTAANKYRERGPYYLGRRYEI